MSFATTINIRLFMVYDFLIERYLHFSFLAKVRSEHPGWTKHTRVYTNSLVNADLFYANFTNMTFQMIPIPHLTRTMKQKFLH